MRIDQINRDIVRMFPVATVPHAAELFSRWGNVIPRFCGHRSALSLELKRQVKCQLQVSEERKDRGDKCVAGRGNSLPTDDNVPKVAMFRAKWQRTEECCCRQHLNNRRSVMPRGLAKNMRQTTFKELLTFE